MARYFLPQIAGSVVFLLIAGSTVLRSDTSFKRTNLFFCCLFGACLLRRGLVEFQNLEINKIRGEASPFSRPFLNRKSRS